MTKKLSNEIDLEIKSLYAQNMNITEIAKKLGVSRKAVYDRTVLPALIEKEIGYVPQGSLLGFRKRNRINPETGKPFGSVYAYNKHIAKQHGMTLYQEQLANARSHTDPQTNEPFKTVNEYRDYLARQRTKPDGTHFESYVDFMNFQASQKIDPQTQEPYTSWESYCNARAAARSIRPEYVESAANIETLLQTTGLKKSQFARLIGISRHTLYKYLNGHLIPRGEHAEKINDMIVSSLENKIEQEKP